MMEWHSTTDSRKLALDGVHASSAGFTRDSRVSCRRADRWFGVDAVRLDQFECNSGLVEKQAS
jgi:hypothetical protein